MKNESAFPSSKIVGNISESTSGMTLRDYFAAKAMQGLIAQSGGTALNSDIDIGVKYAYQMAYAMIEQRERGND